jgi:preprotein translocase subunit SecE
MLWLSLDFLYTFTVIFSTPMLQFIKNALSELEHVVWPTPTETRKYMNYTVGVIITLAILLAILGYSISQSLIFTRTQFPHDALTTTGSGADAMTQADLDELTKNLKTTATTVSGENIPVLTVDTGSVR